PPPPTAAITTPQPPPRPRPPRQPAQPRAAAARAGPLVGLRQTEARAHAVDRDEARSVRPARAGGGAVLRSGAPSRRAPRRRGPRAVPRARRARPCHAVAHSAR